MSDAAAVAVCAACGVRAAAGGPLPELCDACEARELERAVLAAEVAIEIVAASARGALAHAPGRDLVDAVADVADRHAEAHGRGSTLGDLRQALDVNAVAAPLMTTKGAPE